MFIQFKNTAQSQMTLSQLKRSSIPIQQCNYTGLAQSNPQMHSHTHIYNLLTGKRVCVCVCVSVCVRAASGNVFEYECVCLRIRQKGERCPSSAPHPQVKETP